ncbi:hypothetical protein [Shimia sp.]|uniref:hypothetical protein n=1 Tax=Shimia sp. TaxID=1954381 RepID=UPI00356A80E6
MRFATISILASAMVLANPANAQSLNKITNEDDYRAMVVGHKFYDEHGNWVRSNADGTMVGRFNKEKLRGAWNWQGRYFCRNIILGKNELGTDCQVVYTNGTQLQSKRNKGKGELSDVFVRK